MSKSCHIYRVSHEGHTKGFDSSNNAESTLRRYGVFCFILQEIDVSFVLH